MDGLLLIAVIVVAVTVGKPLSYMNCNIIGSQTGNVDSASAFAANMGYNWNKEGSTINYYHWLGATKTTCFEMKAIWGLSIALWWVNNHLDESGKPKRPLIMSDSILFAFSMICNVCLWRRSKAVPPKQVEP